MLGRSILDRNMRKNSRWSILSSQICDNYQFSLRLSSNLFVINSAFGPRFYHQDLKNTCDFLSAWQHLDLCCLHSTYSQFFTSIIFRGEMVWSHFAIMVISSEYMLPQIHLLQAYFPEINTISGYDLVSAQIFGLINCFYGY